MANPGCSAFSLDDQYWATCGRDGKLKIFETATSRLKQEFVPNLHLTSPSSVLEWINVGQQSTSVSSSPRKKRKKRSIIEDVDQKQMVVMGSVDGKVTLYDTTSASVCKILENGHTAKITAMAWCPPNGLYTAAEDHQIVEWNIQENGIKCKWKSGKGKVTALAVLPDSNSIISADRLIKWWSLETKAIIGTFTGHANHISFLKPIKIDDKTSYLVSGASGDAYLGVWSLNEPKPEQTSIATLTMQDDPVCVSVKATESGQVSVLATNRSGQAHLFFYQPNGRSKKPVKPSLTLMIAAESGPKESVQQIPIQATKITQDNKMLLAYGAMIGLTFEKIEPDLSDKVQALVRAEIKWTKEKKDEAVTKVKSVKTDGEVSYLAPGASNATKRTKNAGAQLPLMDRLENLSLNPEACSKAPTKGANMAQLLIQGLASKDRNILLSVLYKKDETMIENTVAKLPVQAITPLLQELTQMVQGKTYPSKIAVTWLRALVTTHAAHLLSLPDVADILSPILGFIDAKLSILPDLSRLRGRVALITGQISHLSEKQSNEIMENCLLTYQDQDSSDEESDVGDDTVESESDEDWEEMTDPEGVQEDMDIENGKSDDDASICS